MTTEQKEAFRREVQEAFDRAQYAPGDHPVVPVKMARLMDDLRRALAAGQPAPAADTGQAVDLHHTVAACEAAAERIRLILVNDLSEPQRSAFWEAVGLRDLCRAALTDAHPAPLDAKRVRELEKALEPFAKFAGKAERFVEGRVNNGGSPILPVKDFCLADFQRARAALRQKEGKA